MQETVHALIGFISFRLQKIIFLFFYLHVGDSYQEIILMFLFIIGFVLFLWFGTYFINIISNVHYMIFISDEV